MLADLTLLVLIWGLCAAALTSFTLLVLILTRD
jgi:hypothetical protein